jgi:hypothetical protein
MNINRYVRTYRNGILVAKFRVSHVKITEKAGHGDASRFSWRFPDKGSKGVSSLVCANVFPAFLDLPISPEVIFFLGENLFFSRIRDQYRVNRRCLLHPHFRVHVQMNVCSWGWVIESNTLRSVASVYLSFPEPTNRWTGTGEPSHRYRL